MEKQLQVRILKELMRQLDEKVNVDAGVMYRNPTSVYTCPDLAKREWHAFFQNHPQLVALSASLPKPGTFMTVDDFGVPVLATRDPEGRFRAFVNSCRHRGVRVAHEERGESEHFMCPFHNWTYSNRGDLIGIPMQRHFGAIDKSCHGLIELPAVERDGLLWVHPRADGMIDLDAQLGGLAPEIASWGFGNDMVYMAETVIDRRLNWKLANDTFGETYHFTRLHKNTLGQVFHGDVLAYEEFGRNHRFVIATRRIDRLREKPEDEWNLLDGTSPLYYLFPNIQFSFGNGTVSLIKIYPHRDDPGRSITRVVHYFSQEAVERAANANGDTVAITAENTYDPHRAQEQNAVLTLSAFTEVFDSTIEQEDYLMGETMQRSAETGQLEHVMFGRNEPALHHYHTHFREALGMPTLERIEM
jgi:phenylpropionate dioxygenase-like ring-hydroxylating dioxygenase large terminal subunit